MQGAVPTIGSLLKSPDFRFMEEVKINEETLRSLDLITVEALLSPNSRYTGRTMQQTNFGRDYGFSVLGISRHGQTIQERPSATRLEYGDSLLLLDHNSNLERLERNPNLILLSQRHFPTSGKKQAIITMLLLGGIILTAMTGFGASPRWSQDALIEFRGASCRFPRPRIEADYTTRGGILIWKEKPSFPMGLRCAVNSPVRYGMEERLVDIKHALTDQTEGHRDMCLKFLGAGLNLFRDDSQSLLPKSCLGRC
jgi:hypothetical protein